ncbi:MAG: DUF6378 domain-containing protein [Candidatus Woesearchaeota archaeon]
MVNKEIDEIIDLCEYLEYDKDFVSADILYAEEVDKKLVKSIDILKRRLLKGRTEYGDSIEETDTILKIFNTITNKQLTSDDYYLLMILTKIIRDYLGTNKNGKFDNILDIAGYSCLWLKKRLDK